MPFHAQMLPGDSPQLRVNRRHQVWKRLFITIAPGGDQSADVPWTLDGHAGADLTKKLSAGCPFCRRFPEYK
jgi:hypothetical protein